MSMDRRTFLVTAAGAALGVTATGARAQTFPAKAVTMVVPFAPGGDTDIRARILHPFLEKHLGTPVTILNKPGAGGIIGYTQISEASRDGYTVGAINFPSAFTPILDGTAKYKFEQFRPLIAQSSTTIVLATTSTTPFKTLRDVANAAKSASPKMTFGIPGNGHPAHLTALSLQKRLGVEFNFVPFGGGAKAVTALLGGHVPIAVFNNTEVIEFQKAGNMHVIAVFAEKRDAALPDVPTAREQDIDVIGGSIGGFAAPHGVPDDVVVKLVRGFESAAQDPAYIKVASERQLPLHYLSQSNYTEFLSKGFAELTELWKTTPWVKS